MLKADEDLREQEWLVGDRNCLGQTRTRFTPEEDECLAQLVTKYGSENWTRIAGHLGSRSARQCRERYRNYLDPGLKHGDWSEREDELLLRLHARMGSNWNDVAKQFEDRSRISVRNRFYVIERSQGRPKSSSVPPAPVPGRKSNIELLFDELVRPAEAEGFSELQFYAEFGNYKNDL